MLSKIVDKVIVYKDKIVINYNIKAETFKQNARCKDDQSNRINSTNRS